MEIYNFFNYKEYLQNHIEKMPRRGRGQFLRLSKALSVHPTLISQVMSGDKHFSQEQGFRVCDYFALDEEETKYFMTMLLYVKAGTQELMEYYKKQLEDMKSKALQVSTHVRSGQSLTEEEAAVFYSQWKYSAMRLLTSLDKVNTRQDLSIYLGLPLKDINAVVSFLLKHGLCEEVDGNLRMGTTMTYLAPESPFYINHLTNWRLKAVEHSMTRRKEDIFITAPMTISHKDFDRVRTMFLNLFKDVSEILVESPSEDLFCLNIDFFEFGSKEKP